MMKKWIAVLLTLLFVLGTFPASSLAGKAKQMRDDVPVWMEDTVKQYALDFTQGNDMERLFSYYDLQIRRYMPMNTFTGMLSEIEWMTGDFVGFGTYSSFEEDHSKTHVLHLCMQKQDLDLYFTHKNKADDWEIMAVEFVPADKQEVLTTETASTDTGDKQYREISVQVGQAPYLLDGVITLPHDATDLKRVPGVVLVHGSGPNDMDESIGQTKLFADIAQLFASKGIATIRYNKRTYTYGKTMTAEEIANLTVEEETIQDAISAGKLLATNPYVDAKNVILLGHSMGAMLAPRIVYESKGVFAGMILVAGTPKSLLDIIMTQNRDILKTLDGDTLTKAQAQVDDLESQINALKKLKRAGDAKKTTIVGVNGYYFWEMMQSNPCKLIIKLKKPTLIVQGNEDFQISLENGIEAYEDTLQSQYKFVEYKLLRKLNHLLMIYTGPAENKGTIAEYDTPATLDTQAGRYLADWVLGVSRADDEE